MYPYYYGHFNQVNPHVYGYPVDPRYGYIYPMQSERQNKISGQATWTDGGKVTQCGLPWSSNQYMTVAVGVHAPYECGQSLKVKNLSTGREVIVTIVDKVPGYSNNKINLHRLAFEALGANLNQGVIAIEFEPSPALEQEKWGKYLLELIQVAYPNYNVVDYSFKERTKPNQNQTKEIYEYILQSPQEKLKVQGIVKYNPETERVLSFNIKEVNH
ncbi:hypothetical protein BN1058_00590 [Paraliobacillus sp. PM-2]|uniref:DUF3889 domain-containing protein n=1 Tax=Paraliobacillus sp. PM-2 TaxID=1462524 RepID=UPI00061BE1C2|nr:DUF3889 domain-containing protein [Paraliobacillus sp. PM-2]CQR46337.1 hypothetical protein BN1058_00590 [Paraliobacillus sp. PM-2]